LIAFVQFISGVILKPANGKQFWNSLEKANQIKTNFK
jgi:hypothetical protein